jgi:hypothetical protein
VEVDVSDVLMIAVVCAFFGMATLYVRLCDRVIGPDPAENEPDEPTVGAHDPIAGHVDHDDVSEVGRAVRVGR